MNTSATNPLPLSSGASGIAHPPRRPGAGFPWIELLLVVTVAAVLLGLSAPSFSRLMQSTSVTDGSNALLSSVFLARSEAREAPRMGSDTSGVGRSSEQAGASDSPPESRCSSRG